MSLLYSAPVRSFCRPAVVAALLALVALGCGGRGDVSGKVTYKGKALVWGTVQFEGSDHMVKQGNINSDGTYSVSGLATGEATAAVSSINPKSSDFQVIRRGEGGPPPKPRPEVKGWFPIPADYQDLSKPRLTYPIKSGQNTIDIDLK
jgi:hypothetical protein